jgi:hypothetical protein
MNPEIKEGHMYQVINNEVVEVVRRGDVLVPITDPIVYECIGQLTLELIQGETDGELIPTP